MTRSWCKRSRDAHFFIVVVLTTGAKKEKLHISEYLSRLSRDVGIRGTISGKLRHYVTIIRYEGIMSIPKPLGLV